MLLLGLQQVHSTEMIAPALQVRRSVAAMTETERKLNAKLLREVDAAASQSGRIAAIRTL